ncbi:MULTISPECIES: Na+/H+ antiporter NhaC [unclassified Mesobacillus]|uniref:Na+/H+ antiporter NhaC n=1 Tax=unclassified Mesobacillus TaxID=2675270 RepID=UPI00203F0BAC|nr:MULTISPECIES: Na+/H+ antiporter NhaC [unclassified Mesobacillus]MCM3123570.1 Na+/H+ antiporter NhaC [Mesobacillus sp. MER 33]MCM3232947.1 Na+/H+ antiporter NhaC [Mesobacillus sp. MER 48]
MIHQNESITLKTSEAAAVIVLLLAGISYGMIKLELMPHIPVIMGIMALMIYGLLKKIKMADLEKSMVEGAKAGLGAVMIFFFIGMLVSSWIAAGTIPTLIFFAFDLVTGKWFYAIVFIITSIVGLSIGSSLTTSAVIGVAFIAVSEALGFSLAITAGAVISGAFLGDKMSPLSDTTVLASSTVKVDLFEHIKNMSWTTIPAFFISLILFGFLSPELHSADFTQLANLQNTLMKMNLVHWYSLIPLAVILVLAIKKVSSIMTLAAGTLTAMAISMFIVPKQEWKTLPEILYSGYVSESGNAQLDSLLSRGGIESMFFSISLVLLALSMGGLLFKLGVLPSLLQGLAGRLEKGPVLIGSAALSALGINLLIGEQYLSILLTGNTFADHFERAGLHAKNLSRVLEDAGTVTNPLVPWSVCGVFLSSVLGVSTMEYVPFAFFCLLSPVLTLAAGFTGITLSKTRKNAVA